MRIIDADALIEKWYEVNNIGPEDRGARFIGYTEIPRFINNAPTVQPTGDLISRADAIEAVEEEDCLGYIECKAEKIYDRINALPSAEAETKCIAQIKVDIDEIVERIKEEYDIMNRWIPCTERLPKEKQEVYVTVYFIEGDTGRAYGYMDGFGKWHLYSTVEGTLNSGYEVTAWMPLPKPYKGGDTE